MTEEEKQSLSALLPFIKEYKDDFNVLETLRNEAEQAFGAEWRTVIPALLNDTDDKDIEIIKTNFRHALDYETAINAWNEANQILNGKDITVEHLTARIPALEYWLSMFGDAGADLVNRLKAMSDVGRADELDMTKTDMTAPASDIKGFAKDISWDFEYFCRLQNYYDQTMSRVGARCVALGGIEMSQYAQYGYILDVLDELVTSGNNLLQDSKYEKIVDSEYKGGRKALQKAVDEYKYELDTNAPPEMVEDTMSADKLKEAFGSIDETIDNTPIGPAADGFEPIPDLDAGDTGKESSVSKETDVINKVVKKVVVGESAG